MPCLADCALAGCSCAQLLHQLELTTVATCSGATLSLPGLLFPTMAHTLQGGVS